MGVPRIELMKSNLEWITFMDNVSPIAQLFVETEAKAGHQPQRIVIQTDSFGYNKSLKSSGVQIHVI